MDSNNDPLRWLEDALPGGKKWETLEHNGILFAPEYVPHGVKMLYEGKPIELPAEAEEVATYFAQHIQSDHMKKPQFSENFFKEFRRVLKECKDSADLVSLYHLFIFDSSITQFSY